MPKGIWGPTSALRARSLIQQVVAKGVPAAQELFRALLLARTFPPKGSGPGALLLRTRIDKLLEIGALDEALELLTLSNIRTTDFLLRRFDTALLTGREDEACEIILGTNNFRPTESARIFCLARLGKWADAVLALAVARESLEMSPEEATLFAHFLELLPEEEDEEIALPPVITPLTYMMLLAIGVDVEATADQSLPIAFYRIDMDPYAPFRARILAAEHLVAAGGVTYPTLFYTYRAAPPAASGGIWDRAAVVQDLDVALKARDIAQIGRHLARADELLSEVDLRIALAKEYGPDLARLPVSPQIDADRMAALLLNAGETDAATRWITETSPSAIRIARDVQAASKQPLPTPTGVLETAVVRAFSPEPVSDNRYTELKALLDESRLGEALLEALHILDARTEIDPGDLTAALRILKEGGQGDTAREISVQTLLMFED